MPAALELKRRWSGFSGGDVTSDSERLSGRESIFVKKVRFLLIYFQHFPLLQLKFLRGKPLAAPLAAFNLIAANACETVSVKWGLIQRPVLRDFRWQLRWLREVLTVWRNRSSFRPQTQKSIPPWDNFFCGADRELQSQLTQLSVITFSFQSVFLLLAGQRESVCLSEMLKIKRVILICFSLCRRRMKDLTNGYTVFNIPLKETSHVSHFRFTHWLMCLRQKPCSCSFCSVDLNIFNVISSQ